MARPELEPRTSCLLASISISLNSSRICSETSILGTRRDRLSKVIQTSVYVLYLDQEQKKHDGFFFFFFFCFCFVIIKTMHLECVKVVIITNLGQRKKSA